MSIKKLADTLEIMDLEKVFQTIPEQFVWETDEGIYLKDDLGNDTSYLIEWERCANLEDILRWVCHISCKGWVSGMVIKDFVLTACRHAGVNLYPCDTSLYPGWDQNTGPQQ